MESAFKTESLPQGAIDPENVVAWLVSQLNMNGTFYKENVVRQYMSALRSAPTRLHIPTEKDLKSVFLCYTPGDLIAYWDICKTAKNYKQVDRRMSGMFSAGMSCLLRYLDYLFSLENTANSFYMFSQSNFIDMWDSGTEFAFQIWIKECTNQSPKIAKNYATYVSHIFSKYNVISRNAAITTSSKAESIRKLIFMLSKENDFCVENKNLNNQFVIALLALEKYFLAESEDVLSKRMSNCSADIEVVSDTIKKDNDVLLAEQISNVLLKHFSNGYRLSSPIEMTRFRSFAIEELGKNITLTDEELKNYISNCGILFDGKVYTVSFETTERIAKLAEEYFNGGSKTIFYSEFYAKNESWLFSESVISEDMLIDILRKLFPNLSFTHTYFGYTSASVIVALEGEILRVWGDEVLLTYSQLAERLQYIPVEKIKYALGQNGDFIWCSFETFTHVSRIFIDGGEREAIREAAVRMCDIRGYVSVTSLPYREIEERNYELSSSALQNAVYRICLSDQFDMRGKIVMRKGDIIDTMTIIKEYCRTVDTCSLDDLLDFERELTGEVNRRIPMEAGNAILVRVDKETYVADRYVHFNVDVIDEVIGLFVKGDYLPLRSFTTFGAFPDCGHLWNLFLLESYCRRFSKVFRFDTISVNSRNSGAIIRKSCVMSYMEIITDAVAAANVPLIEIAVSKFLFDNGYMARSTIGKVKEIVDKLKSKRS